MAVKNFWTFNAGEAIFADKLHKRFKNKIELYFPLKDTGIDLLAVVKNSRRFVTFQIKESRYYEEENSSWHQETRKNFEKNKNRVDFYIFVIYLPGCLANTEKKDKFIIHYVIIPTGELLKRIEFKKINKNGTYDFYFRFKDNKQLNEVRERKSVRNFKGWPFDYAKYLNAWNLIAEKFAGL